MSLLSSLLFGTRYIAMIREATPDRAGPAAPPPPPPPATTSGAPSDELATNGTAEGGAMAAMPQWLRRRVNGWTLKRTRKGAACLPSQTPDGRAPGIRSMTRILTHELP